MQQVLAGGQPAVSSRQTQQVQRFSRVQPHRCSYQVQALAPRLSTRQAARTRLQLQCTAEASTEVKPAAATQDEYYEVFLSKPLGVKFARGNDGAAYIKATDPRVGNTDERIQAGDKIVNVSASFGSDVWEAKNYGQVVYAIKTRSGEVYMKLLKMNGDMSALEEEELTEEAKRFKLERSGGNYGAGTKQIQEKNYIGKRELERKRRELFDDGLAKFKSGNIEGALYDFEEVLAMEPKGYIGDDFSRVTQIYRVSQYNIACCYSSINQVDAGLEALENAMAAGFEQYSKIRSDPNLESLRKSPKFKQVMDRYDEPVLNEGAINALKSIFKFGK
ncbi:hypothetical protein WJX72_003213 [[Myrmecia] bisecta]|uniref:PDZ domain-containing protein n=1 Tax=[Myrmecia] bisecta TaxID=41462 RepID=A0AAW1P5Z9_9CHLO